MATRQAEDYFETGLINLRSDMGGFIHILLVIAIVVVLLRVIKK